MTQRLPNILFIICDDLGINDLRCYGREDHNTPNLDKLAAEGVRFTSAYASQAICSASRAGLLTGLNPARLRLTTYLPGRPDRPSQRVLHPEIATSIPPSIPTFPRYFKEAGYATGFIGKWHIGREYGPAQHGFDFVHYDKEGRQTTPSATEGGKAEFELTRETIRFIQANQHQPWVVYLGHFTPHIPYSAHPDLVDRNRDAFEPVYAALIETLDISVGLILRQLDELGLADDTIVVFTSDNGGLHVPEGGHEKVTHNTPFRAGKGYVYEGGQRVPTLVRWPGRIPAGVVEDAPFNNIDWIPTLLDLVDRPVPAGLDGISIADGLRGGSYPERSLCWHFPHYTNQGGRPSGAVRDGDWLLVELYDSDEVELYNLADDIAEGENLAAERPETVHRLQAILEDYRRTNAAQRNSSNPDFDPDSFHLLYEDVDPSRFDPLTASPAEWERMQVWRSQM